MALDVQITGTLDDATVPVYRLQAETVRIIYRRSPIHAPLPSNTSPIMQDLGQFLPSIVVEGICPETSSTDGGVTIPSKNQMEDFIRQTHESTITFTVSADGYPVKISNFTIWLDGAKESFWHFQLQMVTTGRS